MPTGEWPSREQWTATPPNDPYADMASPPVMVERFRSVAEVEELVRLVREEWKALGRQMRQADGEEEAILRSTRRELNRCLTDLQAGHAPRCIRPWFEVDELQQLDREIRDAKNAERAEVVRRERQYRATDGAWAKELQRRQRIDAWRSDPVVAH